MPTKATLKLIKQLQQKKYRKTEGLFVVEGFKSVKEFLKSDFNLKFLFTGEQFSHEFPDAEIILSSEFKQISNFKTPPEVLAVFKKKTVPIPKLSKGTYFVLDDIQDPGNLGTIIRLSDWFGMHHLFCSLNTVDAYNPKVIQASMGSFSRVHVHYLDVNPFLAKTELAVFGTFMDGANLYTTEISQNSLIVLGNEANGISDAIEKLCQYRIAIPQSGQSTESLNVAMAAAITGSEFFRRKLSIK